jgi:dTDP-4-dehydrorhamnose 3,5-epimerase
MKISTTGFEGLLIIEPLVHEDSRGYFMESFNSELFKKAGIAFAPIQDNESKSAKGVIRGLHYQLRPFDQTKLVRVIEGKILDVAVDIRTNSVTFGKWYAVELSAENRKQLFIPKGFAHGFEVLSKTATIQYKIDNLYRPASERGILFNDPTLGIKWKTDISNAIISDKDHKLPHFNQAEHNF